MTRLDRDIRHWQAHHACYYRPSCVRCWFYAYLDLLRLAIRLKGSP